MRAMSSTLYADAVPKWDNRSSCEYISTDMGLFEGIYRSMDATNSPNAVTKANSVPASTPGKTNGIITFLKA